MTVFEKLYLIDVIAGFIYLIVLSVVLLKTYLEKRKLDKELKDSIHGNSKKRKEKKNGQ